MSCGEVWLLLGGDLFKVFRANPVQASIMNLSVERDDNRLVVGSDDRNHTVMNLLKQAVWDEGGQAGYDKGHPYTGGGKLVITADDPEDMLENAVQRVRDDLDAFKDAFESA